MTWKLNLVKQLPYITTFKNTLLHSISMTAAQLQFLHSQVEGIYLMSVFAAWVSGYPPILTDFCTAQSSGFLPTCQPNLGSSYTQVGNKAMSLLPKSSSHLSTDAYNTMMNIKLAHQCAAKQMLPAFLIKQLTKTVYFFLDLMANNSEYSKYAAFYITHPLCCS